MKMVYKEKLQGPRMKWMSNHQKLVKIILVTGFLGTFYFSFYLTIESVFILGILAMISFFYAFKFGKGNLSTNLRDVPGLKIFLIAGVWAFSCGILPALESESISTESLQITFAFFLYIIGITIPFDVRDLEYDEKTKRTIPQIVGKIKAKWIAGTLIMAAYFLMSQKENDLLYLIPGISASLLLIYWTDEKKDELFYSFGVDGLLVVLPVGYHLWKIL